MISKGKVIVMQDELKRLFNLPEEVEFIAVENLEGIGFEFRIMSKEPIEFLTSQVPNWESMRRQRVPRSTLTPPARKRLDVRV